MKKQFLLFVAIVCSLVTFGQNHKKGGWDISVGPKVYAPLAGNVDWDSKSWGQKVNFSKKNVNFSLGYMQNKAGFAQMPVRRQSCRKLLGRWHLRRNALLRIQLRRIHHRLHHLRRLCKHRRRRRLCRR